MKKYIYFAVLFVTISSCKKKFNSFHTFPGQTITVSGGTFLMGSPSGIGLDSEHPQHSVTVSDFKISKYEITNQQYADFLNAVKADTTGRVDGVKYLYILDSHSQISHNDIKFIVDAGKENYPVINVSWNGAKAYCEYYCGRLPTEAEWEFAARGGNSSNGYTYSGSNNIDEVGWYSDNSDSAPHEIGTKNPNELGIYDMTGNASEWCRDFFDENYYSYSPRNNPQGPSTGLVHVHRGGGWGYFERFCRNAFRGQDPVFSHYYLGFRPVFNH